MRRILTFLLASLLVTFYSSSADDTKPVSSIIDFQWRPTEARSLSEPVEFGNEPSALRQNEFKDLVMLSVL